MMTEGVKVISGGRVNEVGLGDGGDDWSFFRITLYTGPICEIT